MVHQGQRLTFGLETGDHVPRIHPRLDDLERHLAADRLVLFGDKDQPHAPFADLLHQLIGADLCPGTFQDRLIERGRGGRLICQETARLGVGFEESLDVVPP